MELTAPIETLKYLSKNYGMSEIKKVIIYSDSKYVVQGITEWARGWEKRDWKTKAKEPIKNEDLWKKLIKLNHTFSIEWVRLPGHSGVAGNARADDIATMYADSNKRILYHGPIKKYDIDVLDVGFDVTKKNQKKEKQERQRAKAFSYLSLVDKEAKRHKSWKECEKRVKGVSGARFKKTLSKEDEKRILQEWGFDKGTL
jgi:ribonuclease HI